MLCDQTDCHARATLRAYASYNADEGQNGHPLHARYPMPMIRACPSHLGQLMHDDTDKPGSTRQWLVVIPLDGP